MEYTHLASTRPGKHVIIIIWWQEYYIHRQVRYLSLEYMQIYIIHDTNVYQLIGLVLDSNMDSYNCQLHNHIKNKLLQMINKRRVETILSWKE